MRREAGRRWFVTSHLISTGIGGEPRVEIGLGERLPCGRSGGGVSDGHGVSAWTGIHRGPDPPCVLPPSRVSIRRRWMDRCDCDGAGEVDDSRGPSHLVEEMTLDANKHRTSSSRQGQDCLHCSPFARVWDGFSRGISSFRRHRPNHMGGICSRNSCKSVDVPLQRRVSWSPLAGGTAPVR